MSLLKRFLSAALRRPEPETVKVITGLLSQSSERFVIARRALEAVWGPVDIESAILDFTHTKYYDKEFGAGIKRQFFSFERLRSLENIYQLKLYSGIIERRMTASGKRSVNIDPGYINHSKLVLFTTKDYSHRLYLGRGIYAEVTLRYENKGFQSLPWTYPDYQTKEYHDFFERVRQRYAEQVKGRRK